MLIDVSSMAFCHRPQHDALPFSATRPQLSKLWLLDLVAVLLGITVVAKAAPGPGLNQVTWLASEVGKEVYTFSNAVVGAQPTMSDYQMGYLVIGAAHALNSSQ